MIVQNDLDHAPRFAGVTNFRSLGGLPAANGRRLRPHVLMRADRLIGLDEQDWQVLARTGLATICDLRSEVERIEHPNAVPATLRVQELNLRVNNDLRADPSLSQLMAEDPTARGTERMMIEIYRRFPRYMGTTLTAVVERLLAGGAPMLVHCSAGKDRTGFVIAMLLHALDVPEPLIREDYLASRDWPGAIHHRASLEARFRRFMPATELPAAVDTVIGVREVYLDAALDTAVAQYGSINRYLEVAAGLDAGRRDRLRAALLESP